MSAIAVFSAILIVLVDSFSALKISYLGNGQQDTLADESGSRARRDARVLQPPCPAEWNISPCNCTGRPGVPNIDCSAVTDAAALKRIFSYSDYQHFRAIEIHNSNLDALGPEQFGIHTAVLFILSNNKIKTIDKDAFKASSNAIDLIKLDGNQLSSFPFEALQPMTSLRVLVLSNNHLKEIPSDAFPQLDNLQVIDLNGNGLTTIGKNAFSKLKNLQKIFLANNNLNIIGEQAFSINQQQGPLFEVNLADNSIGKIDPNAFANVKIDNLDLTNNQLETLPQAVFEPLLKDGSTISIEGNPLKCDSADLKWLLEKPSNVKNKIQGLRC